MVNFDMLYNLRIYPSSVAFKQKCRIVEFQTLQNEKPISNINRQPNLTFENKRKIQRYICHLQIIVTKYFRLDSSQNEPLLNLVTNVLPTSGLFICEFPCDICFWIAHTETISQVSTNAVSYLYFAIAKDLQQTETDFSNTQCQAFVECDFELY